MAKKKRIKKKSNSTGYRKTNVKIGKKFAYVKTFIRNKKLKKQNKKLRKQTMNLLDSAIK